MASAASLQALPFEACGEAAQPAVGPARLVLVSDQDCFFTSRFMRLKMKPGICMMISMISRQIGFT